MRTIINFIFKFAVIAALSLPCVAIEKHAGEKSAVDYLKHNAGQGLFRITDWYEGLSDITVITVKDLHCNYPVQKNYSILLNDLLSDNINLKLSFIGLEGTSGWLDTSFSASYPDANIRDSVAHYLLKNGYLSGVEYYSIVSDKNILIYGIDDAQLYRKNAEFYLRLQNDLSEIKDNSLKIIDESETALVNSNKNRLQRNEFDFLQKYSYFLTGSISCIEFCEYIKMVCEKVLLNTNKLVQFRMVCETSDIQAKIDSNALECEKYAVMKKLKNILPDDEFAPVLKADMEYSIGKIPAQTFYGIIIRCLSANNIAIGENTQLARIEKAIDISSEIKEPDLNVELNSIVEEIIRKLNFSESKRRLFSDFRKIAVIRKMISLGASRSEYVFFRNNENEFISFVENLFSPDSQSVGKRDILLLLNLAGNFYEHAIKRDESMAETTLLMNKKLKGKTAVIISGGFHADGLAEIFKKRDISYVVLSPVTPPKLESEYDSVMLNALSPLDTMLGGITGMLMPSSNFNNLIYPENKAILKAKWIIFTSVLAQYKQEDIAKMSMSRLREVFARRQNEWLAKLNKILIANSRSLIEQGILSEDEIESRIQSFRLALNQIRFDYGNHLYYQKTLAVPVTISGNQSRKFVITVSPSDEKSIGFANFQETMEKVTMPDCDIRIWSQSDFDRAKSLNEVFNAPNAVPEFTVEPAAKEDLIQWMQDDIDRDLSMHNWVSIFKEETIFIKAVSPEGKILGLLSGVANTDKNAIAVHSFEVCRTARKQSIGKELMKEMVRKSIDSGFDGRIILFPVTEAEIFYSDIGFKKLFPGSPTPTLVLEADKAHELIHNSATAKSKNEAKPYTVTIEEKQKLMILAELFGIDAIDELMQNYSPFNRRELLKENIDYKSIKSIIGFAGISTARELLFWDPQGFFNLAYIMGKDDNNQSNGLYIEFLDELVNQRKFDYKGEGVMPAFIINEATKNDVEQWFSYGVERVFPASIWDDIADDENIIYKAVSPTGRVLGLMAVEMKEDIDAAEIYFIESCSQAKHEGIDGIGTALIKKAVMMSIEQGYKGAIVLKSRRESVEFYTKLGFMKSQNNPDYMILTEDKAKELVDLETQILDSNINVDELAITRAVKLSISEAVEKFGQIKMNIDRGLPLSNSDKLFIIGQIIRCDKISVLKAVSQFKGYYSSDDDFADNIVSLYDRLVNSWLAQMENQGEDEDDFHKRASAAINQYPFDSQLTLPLNPSLAIQDFASIYNNGAWYSAYLELNRVQTKDKTIGESRQTLALARKTLSEHGITVSIQSVPAENPLLQGKTAVTVDNVCYFNENISRTMFWLSLPHEISHILHDEDYAHIRDLQLVNYMRAIGDKLISIAGQLPDNERKNPLFVLGYTILQQVNLYDLYMATAKLELTHDGIEFLKTNNLPRMTEGKNYALKLAAAVDSFTGYELPAQLSAKIERLAFDDAVDLNQFKFRMQNFVIREFLNYSINSVHTELEKIDSVLTSWINGQFDKDQWNFSQLPEKIKPFVTGSQIASRSVDIKQIQRDICNYLREMPSSEAKSELEKQVSQWLATLIAENIKPQQDIQHLRGIFETQSANCLGFSKLFTLIARQFGIDSGVALIEYESPDGKSFLHAINLVRLSNGDTILQHIAPKPRNAAMKRILLTVNENETWVEKTLTAQDLIKTKPSDLRGLNENSVLALTGFVAAKKSIEMDGIPGAMRNIGIAMQIDPENPYVLINLLKLAYFHTNEQIELARGNTDEIASIYSKHKKFTAPFIAKLATIFGHKWIDNFNNQLKKDWDSGSLNLFYINEIYPLAGISALKPVPDYKAEPLEREDTFGYIGFLQMGVNPNSARILIKIGTEIQSHILRKNFDAANKLISGLNTSFAENIFGAFPYILAYMIQTDPSWWHGKPIAEIAVNKMPPANISNAVNNLIMSAKPVSRTADIFDRQNYFDSLELAFEKGDITETQFGLAFGVINGMILPENLTADEKTAVFGTADELPIGFELRAESGFVLGGLFNRIPAQENMNDYRNFVTGLIKGYPGELSSFLKSQGDVFTAQFERKSGVPVTVLLRGSRSAFTVIAHEIMQGVTQEKFRKEISVAVNNGKLMMVLESVFCSNLVKEETRKFIDRAVICSALESSDRDTVDFLKKNYVQGDENTAVFGNALIILNRVIRENPELITDLINIADTLAQMDPSKIFIVFSKYQPSYQTVIKGNWKTPVLKRNLNLATRLAEQSI